MKISVDIDITPQELRAFLGLPDVEPLQREMLDKLRAQIEAGAAGFDPAAIMKPLLAPDLQTMEALQKAFWGALGTGAARDRGDPGKGSKKG